jgi:hypothetical protein
MRYLLVIAVLLGGCANESIVIGDSPMTHEAARAYCKDIGGKLADSSQYDEAVDAFGEFAAPIWPENSIANGWMADEIRAGDDSRFLMISATGVVFVVEGHYLAYPICSL